MQLNEILEENTIKGISQKTKISEDNLENLLAANFDALKKIKTLGFISILEREYKADLSTLREEALAHYSGEQGEHGFTVVLPVDEEKKGKYKHLKEFRGKDMKIGDKIEVSVFNAGDVVDISSVSKGKGFQGAVKRWGFHGRNATHGVKHEHRTLGSVGATGPARVFKGKKMPGRMGFERKTLKRVEIMAIDAENNIMAVKGAVPGRRGTLVEIKKGGAE